MPQRIAISLSCGPLVGISPFESVVSKRRVPAGTQREVITISSSNFWETV